MGHCDYEYEILCKGYRYAYFIWIIVYKSPIRKKHNDNTKPGGKIWHI
jgi:hypothetical protein